MDKQDIAKSAPVPAETLTRRDILRTVGGGVTLGVLASSFGALLPAGVDAATRPAGIDCMTILYPTGDGITFDADYYRDHHLVTIMQLYGKSISRIELRKVESSAPGRPPAAYAAAVNIWLADLGAFNQLNVRSGATLVDDMPHFTNAQPVVQFDQVRGQMGTARTTPQIGDTCMTILYENGADVRWDVDYYRTHHMPLFMKLYGPDAINRFELRQGNAGREPGSKPAFIGTVGIYINHQPAFHAAGKEHGGILLEDRPHFSSVTPTAFSTTIYGID